MRRVCVLALTLFSGVALAGDQTKITVKITNPYGKPVDNAEVIVDFLGSHQVHKLGKRKTVHWEMRSNQDGIAKFPPVPQGTVQLQVYAKRYQTFGEKIDVDTDEKTVEIQLNPPQPQYTADPSPKQK